MTDTDLAAIEDILNNDVEDNSLADIDNIDILPPPLTLLNHR